MSDFHKPGAYRSGRAAAMTRYTRSSGFLVSYASATPAKKNFRAVSACRYVRVETTSLKSELEIKLPTVKGVNVASVPYVYTGFDVVISP